MARKHDCILIDSEDYAWLLTADYKGVVRSSYIGKVNLKKLEVWASERGLTVERVHGDTLISNDRRN